MKKYRKKPVVISAYVTPTETFIDTLEGRMKADKGDYIITGVKGEIYPCKPDIFLATYDEVDENETPEEANYKDALEEQFKKLLEWLSEWNSSHRFSDTTENIEQIRKNAETCLNIEKYLDSERG